MPINHGRHDTTAHDAMAHVVRFDCFQADLDSGELRKRGVRMRLRPQSFRVLVSLIQHPGQVVTRDALQRQLWPGEVFVNFEKSLNTAVAQLRLVLGDSADHPRFIETLPKRGYRFLAAVSEPAPAAKNALSRPPRLLVLPFVNLSGDPAQEYFSDAITDEIITELASMAPEQLAVIARTTAMVYKGGHKDVACIGRELGVDYVVEGGLRHTGDEIAINVQLIQTREQTHLFARKYEAATRDIFSIQSRIAQAIAGQIPAIADRVRTGATGVAHGPKKLTENLTAYNEYIRGRFYMGKATVEAAATAKQHFEKAIARDPGFAPAYDGLAELYWYLGYFGYVSAREVFSAGIVHALRAIEIDNTRAETHALLGQFHKTVEYNWGEVHREMSLARQLDPNSPLVRMRYAVSELMPHGCLEEAVAELESALELDPLSFMARVWLGIMLVLRRRYERAIEESQKVLDVDPSFALANFVLAVTYRYQGRLEEALAAQRRAVKLSGGAAAMLGWLGLMLAGSGQAAEARDVLQQLHGMAVKGYVPPSSFAWIHLGLKEIDTAFEWLNRAVEECDQLMMPIKSYGFFDPIRSDPRFAALLRKMNLEP
jgi:TolB-like protein/Tfp pilus assembly protein PilF